MVICGRLLSLTGTAYREMINCLKGVSSFWGHWRKLEEGLPALNLLRFSNPYPLGAAHGLVSPTDLSTANFPQCQHHTTPLPPAKEWEE